MLKFLNWLLQVFIAFVSILIVNEYNNIYITAGLFALWIGNLNYQTIQLRNKK